MRKLTSALALSALALFTTACDGGSPVDEALDDAGAPPAVEPAAPSDDGADDTESAEATESETVPEVEEPAPKHPEVGKLAPEFKLKDLDGKEHALSSFRGKVVILEWINHGCPFVKKHYDAGNMQKLQRKAKEEGVVWLSICSSAPGKQGHMDSATWKKTQAEKKAAPTAVLVDESGDVGRQYQAKRTPTMYVIDAKGRVAYIGAVDDEPMAKGEAIADARSYVTEAMLAAKAGKAPEVTSTDAYG